MTRIRRLELADPATVRILLPVYQSVVAEELPDDPEPTASELAHVLTPRAKRESAVFAAFHGDTAVGFAAVAHSRLINPPLAVGYLLVSPSHRRWGTGSELLRRTLNESAATGQDHVVFEAPDTSTVEAFAKATSGRRVFTDYRSLLELRPAGTEAPSPAGSSRAPYRTVRWTDRCPDQLLDSYATARAHILDAPSGDLSVPMHRPDAEEVRTDERILRQIALRQYVVAAVTPEEQVAGYVQLFAWDTFQGVQEHTVVVPDHRGRGLALKLRREATDWIRAHEPHLTRLQVMNDSANTWIHAVNDRLGWVRDRSWSGWEYSTS
ncbi:GNAT family N-acetyltransferase [Streptomyces sp. NPDC088270]|uniref:GNAT family N-acetyltransferase n=1 Tax=Streptomyces sp. NPDC088270 TaxID=3160990 RepID=UPI003412C6D9